LSWIGITVALPFSTLEYGVAAILAVTMLQEQVTPLAT
jgi:hypothetical protein